MKLNKGLAQKIVENTNDATGKNIIVTDSEGYIIGDGNMGLIDMQSEVAFDVIEKEKSIRIIPSSKSNYEYAEEGIYFPVEYDNNILGVVGIQGNVKKVKSFRKIVENVVKLILEQKIKDIDLELKHRIKDSFYHDLLAGKIDEERLEQRIQASNIKKDKSRSVIIVYPEYREVKIKDQSRVVKIKDQNKELNKNEIINLYKQHIFEKDDIIIPQGDSVIIIKSYSSPNKKDIIGEEIKEIFNKEYKIQPIIGIGNTYSKLEKLHLSYNEAQKAITLGKILNQIKDERIFHFKDLGIDTLITYIKVQDMKKILKNNFDYDNVKEIFEDKYETGKTIHNYYLNNMNISKTADSLNKHRNTLSYRMKKIEEQTGFNLKNSKDLLTLLMGYHFYLYIKYYDEF